MFNKNQERDSYIRLQAMINAAVDGIITIDTQGIIESINPAGAKLFGYAPEEVIGQNVKVLMPEPYHSEHDGYLSRYHETGEKRIIGIGREVQGLRKDKTTFPFRLSVGEVDLSDGKIFTGIIHDISDKVLAAEIQKALDKERELNELKSRFVSIASHEFRTPLTSIYTSATLIGKYKDEGTQYKREKHIKRIKASVQHLTNILNDFLSLSKLEEGKIEHLPLHFNLKNFIKEVVEQMQVVAKEGQVIDYQHNSDIEKVFLDKKLLNNILINLLSNAIKYSNTGKKIEVTSSIQKSSISIKVRDYGIGIPDSAKKKLFERFFRAVNVSNEQGTGLGLNIVKKYLSLMSGEISYESKLNEGTTFTLYFEKNK